LKEKRFSDYKSHFRKKTFLIGVTEIAEKIEIAEKMAVEEKRAVAE